MIYFIQCNQAVKIGHTTRNPLERLQQLQIGNPYPLTLLATIPGERPEEGHLHARFKEHLIRGEWYMITPTQLAEVILSHLEASPWQTTELAVAPTPEVEYFTEADEIALELD